MNFLCVLKTGGIYEKKHVDRLRNQLTKLTSDPLYCLTDSSDLIENKIQLKYNFPGWWSKLEMFNDDYGECCYIDLDVIIQKIDWVYELDKTKFHAMKDEYIIGGLNSSVMIWSGRRNDIFGNFNIKIYERMHSHTKTLGDQRWIGKKVKSWEKITYPNVAGYRKYGQDKSAGILVFYGNPKPWDL